MKSILSNILKFALMFGILAYLYQKGLLDFSKVHNVFRNPVVVAYGFLVVFATALAAVYRWTLLLEGQGIHIKFSQALRLTFIGMFFNTALPGAVSGDVVKGYYIVRQQPDGRGKSKAFATLLFDRILGVSGLVSVSFLAMVFNLRTMLESSTLKPLVAVISFLSAGTLIFYVLVLPEWSFTKKFNRFLKRLPMGDLISKVFEAVKCYENNPDLIIKGFLVSCAIHCSIVSLFVVISSALTGFEMVPLARFFLLTPLGLLVTAIPIAPAGLGTGHAAFFGLFQLVQARGGADLFTAYVVFQILVSMVGGIFYVRYQKVYVPRASS